CMIQGPIERFQVFQNEMDYCFDRRRPRDLVLGILRICWGITKALIATLYFLPVIRSVIAAPWGADHGMRYYEHPESIESYWLLYFGVFINIYWLYLEFSGYCDVSAGIARIFGYRQIENFNWVWFATSLRDFWRRWHISLSAILRDYVYIPLGGNRGRVWLNLMLTFGICGIWHKIIPQMFLWGILMGFMLWVNQKWVAWTKSLAEREDGFWTHVRHVTLRIRPIPQFFAWLLTMHAFVFSLLIFFGGVKSWRVLKEIVRRPLEALFG
ncbi:MAG: MBOAT family O-acyltransferase, partial [Phycisphaerae bacterium]